MTDQQLELLLRVALIAAIAAFAPYILRGLRKIGLAKEAPLGAARGFKVVFIAVIIFVALLATALI